MNALTQAIASLTPPPFVPPVDYDGLEYKWRFLAFRPAYFEKEAYLLAGVLFYAIWAFIGAKLNERKANAWASTYTPLLSTQFSKPLVNGLTADGKSDFFSFSTGRKHVQSLHTIFTFRPRHDAFQIIYEVARGLVDVQYNPVDDLQLDFTLAPTVVPDFVCAIVAKSELRTIKKSRWDLEFTKTSESAALPTYMSLMSEFADVTDSLLKNTPLGALLADPAIQPYFRSLSITDQPRVQPDPGASTKEKHLIISLVTPSNPAVLENLVAGVFGLIDSLPKVTLRPETKTKLRKAREDVEKKLKEANEKEQKEEALDDRRAAKKKAEEERVAKLSATDQQKYLDRERKRELRKSQSKNARK